MTRQISSFLLALLLLFVSLRAQAESCEVCGDTGYLEMPGFGTNELIRVNCTGCGGTLDTTEEAAEPSVTIQAVDTLQLIDPGDYANGDDQCVYAESWYAVFECKDGYDMMIHGAK